MEPNELLLFVRSGDSSLNGGLTADFGLNNKVGFWNTGPDNLRVAVNGTTIDEITWLPADVEEGYSLALHPNNQNATDNDDLSYWCDGTFEFTSNNFGSPGTANELCGESIATQVQPMFNSECTSCHSGSSASASLDLSSANAWDNLSKSAVPRMGAIRCGTIRCSQQLAVHQSRRDPRLGQRQPNAKGSSATGCRHRRNPGLD